MIELKNVKMRVPGFTLKDINIKVEQGQYFILLGPTGAGKTLLLETICGTYKPEAGDIIINGRLVNDIPPEKRSIGIVYQDQALFSHLSVKNNILFGLKVCKAAPVEQEKVLEWLCALLGIRCLLERSPVKLSGGERQKVALARALAVRPDLLLLDEPLSALDPEGHERLQEDLKQIHRELGITTLHVTHDFEEAMSLGQRVAVLENGCVCQIGSPDDIFLRPASVFVAGYTMSRNIFPGRIVSLQNGFKVFETDTGWRIESSSGEPGSNYACIRPESITISHLRPSTTSNVFSGHIINIARRGFYSLIRVGIEASEIYCYALHRESREIKGGQSMWISFEPQEVYLLRDTDN